MTLSTSDGLTIPDPLPDVSAFQLAPWIAPPPDQLPFLRRRLYEHYAAIATHGVPTEDRLNDERFEREDDDDQEARSFAGQEAERLGNASLTWVDAATVEMALTYSSTPSTEPARADRLPSTVGFMMFEIGIGGALYDVARSQEVPGSRWKLAPWLNDVRGEVQAPVIAVSWSRQPPPYDNRVHLCFYTPHRAPRWDGLPRDTFVAEWPLTGRRYGAGYFADHVRNAEAARRNPLPLLAHFPATMMLGELLPEAGTRPSAGWIQAVYGLWQLLDHQSRKPLTSTEARTAPRTVARGDERAGITADSVVNIVRVHPRFTTEELPAADEDAREDDVGEDALANSRRQPHHRHRYWRGPYRANACMNPHGHKAGNCEHKEVPVGRHLRGPVGAPFLERVTEVRGSPTRGSKGDQPAP
ncbi:hypothetical protein SUDANB95_07985 (plasmid) [Actinosynnema sp. ALI-1.44]